MPQDNTIARNLRRIMYDKGITQAQLARQTGFLQATVSYWMNGTRTPRLKNIDMLCTYLGVNRSDLLEEHSEEKQDARSGPSGVKIKVYGRVAAGVPLEMIEDVYDEEEIHPDMLKGGQEYFGLIVHGTSMEPRMTEGDIVIVRKQPDAETGDIVIAAVNGDDATCKVLKKENVGIWLMGTNPSFGPMFFSNSDIERLPVTILGKVVELRAKF